MAIDTSGRWWRGENPSDLAEYLQLAKPGGYRVDRVLAAVCDDCAGTTFKLRADADEGGVERTCAGCAKRVLMLDTGDHWDDMDLTAIECPCGSDLFEVSVGFSFREGGEIRWVSVGQRCAKEGVLGYCADWKIDYGPNQHLLARVLRPDGTMLGLSAWELASHGLCDQWSAGQAPSGVLREYPPGTGCYCSQARSGHGAGGSPPPQCLQLPPRSGTRLAQATPRPSTSTPRHVPYFVAHFVP